MALKFTKLFTRRWVTIGLGTFVVIVAVGGTAAGLAISSDGTTTAATPTSVAPPSGSVPPSPVPTAAGSTPTTSSVPLPAPASAPTASKIISETCLYSHEANDDPILMPGGTGQSMAHDFFGNATTSATSTAAALVGGMTSCSTSADASAYWTPVLYQNGVAITPTRDLIYWAGLHVASPAVTVPPAGLEMIAGDENATAPQSTKVIDWRCASPATQGVSATPVNCVGSKGIELRVTFPSCWNGRTINGASETNVAYPVDARCPVGYPVRIPTIIFHVVYPITTATGLTLSMGPGQQGSTDTAHGDFINGWNQSVLADLISGCEGPAHNCGHVDGPDATVVPKRA